MYHLKLFFYKLDYFLQCGRRRLKLRIYYRIYILYLYRIWLEFMPSWYGKHFYHDIGRLIKHNKILISIQASDWLKALLVGPKMVAYLHYRGALIIVALYHIWYSGFGLSLCYVAAIIIVAYYFDRRRSFATGISVCGSGVGRQFPHSLTNLLNRYRLVK